MYFTNFAVLLQKEEGYWQQCDDILGVKTRWIRKQKNDKKGVFFRKVNYRVGQTMRQNRNMFREKGCATNREVILYNYRKMIND